MYIFLSIIKSHFYILLFVPEKHLWLTASNYASICYDKFSFLYGFIKHLNKIKSPPPTISTLFPVKNLSSQQAHMKPHG